MDSSKQPYVRFRGRGTRSGISMTVCTLWFGTDHLLQVDSVAGFTEEYKRFYYRDIQGLIVRKTARAQITSVLLGLLAVPFLLLAVQTTGAAAMAMGIVAAIFLAALIANIVLGPACVCHLRTAVQTEYLPSLKRLRTVRRLLAILEPRIAEAQGMLTADEIREKLRALAPGGVSSVAEPATAKPPPAPDPGPLTPGS